MEHRNWECPKCNSRQFETDQFSATGGFWTKIFDIQSKKFTTITCSRCTYTEIYKTKSSALSNVLDFFTG
ncbi:zinc ribbon domain-containing protein [Desulfogranum japonicum]|uniref:zinc ribbon domain-containing protein n=1 Tax=Desulfogranum japonicum TaxID=231447 RepID=UPI000427B029|nr:zinc ribbon domain-containing protein [Desulfogranum japonicum]